MTNNELIYGKNNLERIVSIEPGDRIVTALLAQCRCL
jgi:hypothetical protein